MSKETDMQDGHVHAIHTELPLDAQKYLGEEGKELMFEYLEAWAAVNNNLVEAMDLFFAIHNSVSEKQDALREELSQAEYIEFISLPYEAYKFLSMYESIWGSWDFADKQRELLDVMKQRHQAAKPEEVH